ncbi:MAG: hypothetical protein ACYCOR_10820 [Acidobacteriaceae bacterium]
MSQAPGWIIVVLVLIALAGPPWVVGKLAIQHCPNCNYGHVRVLHRTRLWWVGVILFFGGMAYPTGIAFAMSCLGLLMILLSPLDQPRLLCRACGWGGPATLQSPVFSVGNSRARR